MEQRKAVKDLKKHDATIPKDSCSLCGQKYNNFVFKGGYICETCLTSLKKAKPESNQ